MTEETVADMVWGLEHDIEIRIFDPTETRAPAPRRRRSCRRLW